MDPIFDMRSRLLPGQPFLPENAQRPAGFLMRTYPSRQFRNSMLETPPRFTNDEFHVLRFLQQFEMWTQQIAEAPPE